MKPSSFCAISTYTCHNELIGLLLSLSLHHPDETVFCLIDSKTQEVLDNMTPKIKLDIRTSVSLDRYSGMNRREMEIKGIWNDFQMSKANVIKWALSESSDTYFLDADIIILDEINYIDNSKDIGVSPQLCAQKFLDETGKYNGGTIWVNNKNVPDDWIEFTKTSRFHDQASIEDLVKKYSYQEFDECVNFGWWRLLLVGNKEQVKNNIKIVKDKLCYNNKPIKYFHTHFHDKRFTEFNNLFIINLMKMKKYRELLIIERVIRNKWTIQIPRQPQQQIWRHNNDSFRELALLFKKNNNDLDIELIDNGHCWIRPFVLLYDRPTSLWFNNDINKCYKLLLGNGDINIEGKQLLDKNINVSPWIFWPRRPMILEKILDKNGIISYKDREIETIFIGNYENNIQEKYRKTDIEWSTVLTEYHCTAGDKHKFTAEEYLMKLRSSRYGLCLRGYGSKCHREVELMAFGTVPIVTPEVSIKSYMEPLIENKHYIAVKDPEELVEKLRVITEEDWKLMSKQCYEWYQRNVYSKNSWNNMIYKLFYS